jgi:hypothetical protein
MKSIPTFETALAIPTNLLIPRKRFVQSVLPSFFATVVSLLGVQPARLIESAERIARVEKALASFSQQHEEHHHNGDDISDPDRRCEETDH